MNLNTEVQSPFVKVLTRVTYRDCFIEGNNCCHKPNTVARHISVCSLCSMVFQLPVQTTKCESVMEFSEHARLDTMTCRGMYLVKYKILRGSRSTFYTRQWL